MIRKPDDDTWQPIGSAAQRVLENLERQQFQRECSEDGVKRTKEAGPPLARP